MAMQHSVCICTSLILNYSISLTQQKTDCKSMIKSIEALSENERNFLKDVPVWITILIAGADNQIDDNETEWAQKIIRFRAYTAEPELLDYYHEVGKEFNEKLMEQVKHASKIKENADIRNKKILGRLSQLNEIFEKIDKDTAVALYESYRSFAMHVAKASGGAFGMGSIKPEEQKWLELETVKKP
jgi:hypothetical protein